MTEDDNALILTKLAIILREILKKPSTEYLMEMQVEDVENWDSFHHVNIIIAVEMQWGIKFKTFEMARPKTIGDLVQMIGLKLKQKR
jgi:acyl carrier protein